MQLRKHQKNKQQGNLFVAGGKKGFEVNNRMHNAIRDAPPKRHEVSTPRLN
jgi:hypothetical protein